MFKILAFQPENGFFAGDLPDSCGSPRICHFYGDCNYTKLNPEIQ